MYFPLQLKQNFLSFFPSGSKALAFEIEKKVSSIRKRWLGNQIYKFVWSPKSKTNFLKRVCVLTDYISYPTIERWYFKHGKVTFINRIIWSYDYTTLVGFEHSNCRKLSFTRRIISLQIQTFFSCDKCSTAWIKVQRVLINLWMSIYST